jgi:biopolymer transport protein ExbB/TolQ
MKKLFRAFSIMTAILLLQPAVFFAQATTNPQSASAPKQLDEKTQKKVDKAEINLAKDKKTLSKAEEDYNKGMAKHTKKQKQGKLSPDDELKEAKAKQKAEKNIAKLRQRIAKNEAILAQYKM